MQYKSTKSKRLEELENRAREFEVLASVNLSKILGLLESKQRKVQELERVQLNMDSFLEASHRQK
jgi:hypothetical protein